MTDNDPLWPDECPADPDAGNSCFPPADPDAGPMARFVPLVPDTDPNVVPGDVQQRIEYVEQALASGSGLVEEVLGPVVAGAESTIQTGLAGFHSGVGEVIGTALVRTDQTLDPLVKQAVRLLDGVQRKLAGGVGELAAEGIRLPLEPSLWPELVEANPEDWFGTVFPAPPEPQREFPRPPPGWYYTAVRDGACCKEVGMVDGPAGPMMTWMCTRDPTLCDFSDPDTQPPPPPPPLNPPPPPPPPPPGECPAPVVQCPDVLVNVPETDWGAVGKAIGEAVADALPDVIPAPDGKSPSQTCPTPPPPPPITITVPESKQQPDPGLPIRLERPKGVQWPADVGNWWTFGGCVAIDNTIRKIENPGPSLPPPAGAISAQLFNDFLRDMFNVPGHENRQTLTRIARNLTEAASQVTAAVVSAPSVILETAASATTTALSAVDPAAVQNLKTATYYAGRLATAYWAESITKTPLSYLYQSDLYDFQYANPQYLIGQTQIDSLWVNDYITDETWECLTRAQGNIPTWASLNRDNTTRKASLDELIRLRLRKEITETQLIERAKKVGYNNPQETLDIKKLATQIPTQADLLRMMVRDSADENVVKKFNYDKDFNDKFTGKLKDWAEAQGIPAEIFLFFWRAHWDIPSNTQLYEMFHRLRPDRQEVKEWDELARLNGAEEAEKILGPRPQVVTIEDVRQAIEINDMAPAWVQRLIDISYHPITRTDAVRAYQIGAFTEDQLKSAMLDNGYDEKTSDLLVKFYKQSADRVNSNAAGVLTIRKIVSYYKSGAMSRFEADRAIEPLMTDADRRRQVLDRVDTEVAAENRKAKLAAIKRRYVAGEQSAEGYFAEVNGITFDANRTAFILELWETERTGRLKEPTAMMLCKWYDRNLLTADEYLARLLRLGYTAADAQRIAQACDIDKRRKLQRAAVQAAKELQRQAEKAERERVKRLKENCDPPKLCNPDGSPINPAQSGSNSSSG